MTDSNPLGQCPHCGETIKKSAVSCPFCGSDEKTGWSDDVYLDNIDIGEEIDYDQLVAEEFPQLSSRPKKIPWIGIISGVVLFFFIAGIMKILL